MTVEELKRYFSSYFIRKIKERENLPDTPFYIDYGQGIDRKSLERYYDVSFLQLVTDTTINSSNKVFASYLIDSSVYVNKIKKGDVFLIDKMFYNVIKMLKPTINLENMEKIKIRDIRTEELNSFKLKQISIRFDLDFYMDV